MQLCDRLSAMGEAEAIASLLPLFIVHSYLKNSLEKATVPASSAGILFCWYRVRSLLVLGEIQLHSMPFHCFYGERTSLDVVKMCQMIYQLIKFVIWSKNHGSMD